MSARPAMLECLWVNKTLGFLWCCRHWEGVCCFVTQCNPWCAQNPVDSLERWQVQPRYLGTKCLHFSLKKKKINLIEDFIYLKEKRTHTCGNCAAT